MEKLVLIDSIDHHLATQVATAHTESMSRVSYRATTPDDITALATYNISLLEQQGIDTPFDRYEAERRIEELLDDGFQAVIFLWDGYAAGYCLYKLHPKYAFIRHFYVDRKVSKKLKPAEAFSALRNGEFREYASVRVDVPENAKKSLQLWEDMGFVPRSVRLELQTAKKSGTRKSCGAVIFRRRLGQLLFLVIQHEKGGHWGFSKGHGVAHETEMETARREIHEETGLHVDFVDGFYERLYYLTPRERRKEVVYFLSRVRSPKVTIQRSEIRDFEWLPYWETRQLLTYENTRLVLDKAYQMIRDRNL